jgi:hypothetical protein
MPQTLLQKLNLKPGWLLGVLHAPPEVFALLQQSLPGVTVGGTVIEKSEGALIFLRSLAEVHAMLPDFFSRMASTPVVWLAYPKGSSGVVTDINRDILWKEIAPMGWHPVRQVALDEVWSALRFMQNKPE